MITKSIIREDGFNIAIIEKMYQSGEVVATLQQIETDAEGVETIIKQDTNIVFDKDYFEFTQEELDELNGIIQNDLIIE